MVGKHSHRDLPPDCQYSHRLLETAFSYLLPCAITSKSMLYVSKHVFSNKRVELSDNCSLCTKADKIQLSIMVLWICIVSLVLW